MHLFDSRPGDGRLRGLQEIGLTRSMQKQAARPFAAAAVSATGGQRRYGRHAPPRSLQPSRTVEPVSIKDLRLEMIFGQPLDTDSINFEDSRSMP